MLGRLPCYPAGLWLVRFWAYAWGKWIMHPCYSNLHSVTFALGREMWGAIAHERVLLLCSSKNDDTSEKLQMFSLRGNCGFCPGKNPKYIWRFYAFRQHYLKFLLPHVFFFHFRCTSGATFNPVCDPDASKEPHVYVYMPSTYHLSVVLQLTFINYRLNSLEMWPDNLAAR